MLFRTVRITTDRSVIRDASERCEPKWYSDTYVDRATVGDDWLNCTGIALDESGWARRFNRTGCEPFGEPHLLSMFVVWAPAAPHVHMVLY